MFFAHFENRKFKRDFLCYNIPRDFRGLQGIPCNPLKSPEILENGLLSRGNLIKYKNETGANVKRSIFHSSCLRRKEVRMVSKRIQKALLGNSAIRAMFVEGKEMAAKYGAENV